MGTRSAYREEMAEPKMMFTSAMMGIEIMSLTKFPQTRKGATMAMSTQLARSAFLFPYLSTIFPQGMARTTMETDRALNMNARFTGATPSSSMMKKMKLTLNMALGSMNKA